MKGPIQSTRLVGPRSYEVDMKCKENSDGATGRRSDTASRVSALLFVIIFCFFAFAHRSSAHEPITTKVRFNKELVRILQRNCLGCHHPGGIAFSLATYDEARPWAKAIKEEVLEKRMPPWHVVKGYGDFRNAPSLAQRDIDLIVNWVEGGAPKGDDQDLPAGPLFSNDWQLGKPDLIIKQGTEAQIASDADEHRTFALNTGLKEDRWLTAIDLMPGNSAVVHCATVYLLSASENAQPPAAMMQLKSDDSEATNGSDMLRNSSVLATVLGTWMPGQQIVALDAGVAQLIPAGSRLGVEIHYRGSGEPARDLSAVGLYFAKQPVRKQVTQIVINDANEQIPAAAQSRRLNLSYIAPADSEAIAIRPAAHPLLVSLQATAYRPDGSQEVLIWSRGYKWDWRPTYYFKRPVALPKGTRVEVIAYVDNSDENQNNPNSAATLVKWSDITNQPLCTILTTSSPSR